MLFARKMVLMLYSINWPNFIVWWRILLEILGNMCIVTVCWPGCGIINLKINFISANICLYEDVFRLCLQKASSRCPDQDEYIYLIQYVVVKTNIFVLVIGLQDVFKRSCKSVFKTSWKHVQDVFKRSSKHLQYVLLRCFEFAFKTSSRRLAKMSSRYFEDVSSS